MTVDYSKFKSGSDIRGYALGDETNPLFMSDEMVMRASFGFLSWLKNKTGKENPCISVGHDSRLSAERIKNAVIKALSSNGARVIDCSLASTPAMFMTTVELGCDGAVQITASHHPKDRNGLKFFTRDGGLDGNDIADILDTAGKTGHSTPSLPCACLGGTACLQDTENKRKACNCLLISRISFRECLLGHHGKGRPGHCCVTVHAATHSGELSHYSR